MSEDITEILQDWQYEPDDIQVRVVEGDDGRRKIQLRVDLGMLQMEIDGRPDGARPEQCESLLIYHQKLQRARDEAHPDAAPYLLGEDDCAELWREGLQYYHRYLAFWHLKMYELCARDTRRNLDLFAFVCAHCDNEQHRVQFDQWRPYVIMMHTRSVATPLIDNREFDAGLRAIEAGIEGIHEFLDEYQQDHRAEECVELTTLERWRQEILANEEEAAAARPKSALEVLRQKLDEAVAAEEFEKAARHRDEIRQLRAEADPTDDE